MRKFFEWEWIGIEFTSFCRPSTQVFASPDFWETFYQTLFQRFHTWNDLDPNFRAQRRGLAEFIFGRLESQEIILSIGCGLGYVEHCLLEWGQGTLHLEVTEVAPAALKLIQKEIPSSRIHVGFFPECLPPDLTCDLILLCDIDLTLDQPSLTRLLHNARGRLATGGRCLLISGLFDPPVSVGWKLLRMVKNTTAAALAKLNLLYRGQWLGIWRTRKDFHSAFLQAGYSEFRDGFFDVGPNPLGHYWIEARRS